MTFENVNKKFSINIDYDLKKEKREREKILLYLD